jgi:hypothetical protein
VTHRFGLADVMKAFDTFGNAAKERALKVILPSTWHRGRQEARAWGLAKKA